MKCMIEKEWVNYSEVSCRKVVYIKLDYISIKKEIFTQSSVSFEARTSPH